jgi:ribose transport system permease protein
MSLTDLTEEPVDRAGPIARRGFRPAVALRSLGIVWITLALFTGLSIQTTNFFTGDNLSNILDQQSASLIVAAFATFVLIAGGFDTSLSAIFILSPLVALRVEHATSSAGLMILTGVATGLCCGVVNGVLVTAARINSFIATLATSFAFFGVAYLVSGSSILQLSDLSTREIVTHKLLGITAESWMALGVVVIAATVLAVTRFGRYVYAVGGNPEAARLAGVPVARVQATTFVLAGAAAGFAGTLSAINTVSAQASDDYSLVFGVVAAIVVGGTSIAGGTGAVWRSVVGVLFIGFVTNGFNLNGIDPIYQRIIEGAVIVIAVSFDAWTRGRRT